jgi:non-heme chloroperoxidase
MNLKYRRRLASEERIVLSADGTRLSTVSMGAGTPVVLAHGYTLDMHCWTLVAERLVARGFRVIAFDQRGHGRSGVGSQGVGSRQMVDDYLAVLSAHEVKDGVLVGHSMGGFLSIRAMIEQPKVLNNHLRGCLLMATFAGDVNRKNFKNRIQIPLVQSGIMAKIISSHAIAALVAKSMLGEVKDPQMVDAFIETLRNTNLKQLVPILREMVKEDRYAQLGSITLPCRVVVGEKDEISPSLHAELLHQGISGSTLKRVPRMGHMLNWEVPDVLVEEIIALAE